MKTYKELLKDGRWQIKKSSIMERDHYECRICGRKASDGVTLNVHHLQYRKGANPWEYDDNELVTLCEDCHRKEHGRIKMELLGISVGDFVYYHHSDYTNSGLIYDINSDNMTAKIATVDDGAANDLLWLESVKINEDGTLERCRGKVTKDGKESINWDFCLECTADCLMRIMSGHRAYMNVEVEMDEKVELITIRKNIKTMLENNSRLKEYFNKNGCE